jgi:hypothetical protein
MRLLQPNPGRYTNTSQDIGAAELLNYFGHYKIASGNQLAHRQRPGPAD